MDDLALEVGQVDLIVVDDAQRPHARRGQIQRDRAAEPAGAEQQHLGVEQLLLTVGPNLGEQQVARVALALFGAQRARNLDRVATVLPQREATGHRLDVLVAKVLDERPRRPGRAVARGAIQHDVGRAVRHAALDPGLEIALGHVLGPRDMAGGPLLGLAHVNQDGPVAELLTHLAGIDLVDPALDIAEYLRS